ncbi:uncharacterized [Tachysurus ichikawai]
MERKKGEKGRMERKGGERKNGEERMERKGGEKGNEPVSNSQKHARIGQGNNSRLNTASPVASAFLAQTSK